MNRAIIEKELTQGVVPIGTPKAYQYDQALVESAVATVQQGLTDITVKAETEMEEMDSYIESQKIEVATLGQGYVDEANTILSAVRDEYGYPFVASTVAEMTDPAKIYVYTGSETGYTNGNWYYNDGTDWVSGGIYNAIAFTTDTTLTVSGEAADSKATGDNVFYLKDTLGIYQPVTKTIDHAGGPIGATTTSTSISAYSGDTLKYKISGTAFPSTITVATFYLRDIGGTLYSQGAKPIGEDLYIVLPFDIMGVAIVSNSNLNAGTVLIEAQRIPQNNIIEQVEKNTEDISNSATVEQFAEVTRKMVRVETQNLFNYEDSTVGWISNVGTTGTNSTYCWVKLDVEEGDVLNSYAFSGGGNAPLMRYVCPYDSNGNVISGAGAESVRTYTVPSGCVKIAVTIYSATKQYFVLMKNNESAPTEYIPYSEPYYKSGNGFVDTDKTLSLSNVPADAKVVGDKFGETFPITPSKTTFMYASKNLVDPSGVTVGYYIKPSTGLPSSNSNYSYTDYIPVTEGTNYGIVGKTSASLTSYFAWYNASKTRIAGGSGNTQTDYNNVLTAPANASFLRFSTLKGNFPIDIEESDSLPQYEPYGYAYVLPQYMPPNEDVFDVVVNLPSKIYATVGYELNIYFENIVEEWEKYQWDVACSVGKQMARGYTITPAESNVGTYTLSITIKLGDKSKTVQTSLVIVSANAGSGLTRSMIILGDSTTANGIAVTKLHENFANDPMTIETWGTQGTSPNNHEGRSGWKLEDYFTKESVVYPEGDPRGTIYNGFYNPETMTFDASYYFANSGVSEPNWFIVNMGINDMFGYTTDSALESAIEQCVTYVDDIITSVQGVSSDIKLAICLTIPPNHSQDAFGKAYNCSQTRDRYKHNNLLWVHRLIEEYDNRTDDGVFVIPIFTNLDTIYNMGMETVPVNARNTEITYQSPILNGGVHPVTSGYWQIADIYTAFLKAQA